jgi:hypothetical protein
MMRGLQSNKVAATLSSYDVEVIDYNNITSPTDVFGPDQNELMKVIYFGRPDVAVGHFCLVILRDADALRAEFFDPLAIGSDPDACARRAGLEVQDKFKTLFTDYHFTCNTWGPQNQHDDDDEPKRRLNRQTCGRWVIHRAFHAKMTSAAYTNMLEQMLDKGIVDDLDKFVTNAILIVSP